MNTKYHTYNNHIKPMLDFIDSDASLNEDASVRKKMILKLAAIFHDIVYEPGAKDNEDKSAQFFKDFCNLKSLDDLNLLETVTNSDILWKEIEFLSEAFSKLDEDMKSQVIRLIENTKNPFDMRYDDELGHYFAKLDVYGLTQDYYTIHLNEQRIYNEFKNVCTAKEYNEGRIKFLNEVIEKIPNVNKPGIKKLIAHIMNRS